MALISVDNLQVGMILSDDVYVFNNKLLLAKETPLTDYMINKLRFYGVKNIKVADFSVVDTTADEETNVSESYIKRLKHSAEFKAFKEKYFKNIYQFKTDFLEIANDNKKIDSEEYMNKISTILDGCNGISVFDMLHCMRDYDDATFVHALNTALICNVFAGWLGWNEEDTDALTLAGLLHDIGKIRVPDTIVKKTGALSSTESSLMQAHVVYGYEILKNQPIDERIKLAALMHHEHCNGTGYPKALSSNEIADFAKIIAIASEYDSLTSSRSYREAICPFEVIKKFELEGLQKYDARYILTFLEHISNSLINLAVLLSDGQEAEVVMINRQFLSRPIVKTKDSFIDLSKNTNLYIQSII